MIPSKGGSSAGRSSIGSNNSRDVKGDNNNMEGPQHFQDDGHSSPYTDSPLFSNVAEPEDRLPSTSMTEVSNASTINWLYSQKAPIPVHSVLSEASQVLSAGSTTTTTSSMLHQGSAHMLSTLEPKGNMVHTLLTLHEEWQGPQHTSLRMGTARQKAYVSPLDLIKVGVKIDTHHTIHDLKPTFREDLQLVLTETLEQALPRCSFGIARATARPGCIQLVLELLCQPDMLASKETSAEDESSFLMRSVSGPAPNAETRPSQLVSYGREQLIRLLAETLAVQAVQALQLDTKELQNGHQVEVQVEDYVCTAVWDATEQLWRTSSAQVDPHKFHLDVKQVSSSEKQPASPSKAAGSSSSAGIKAKVMSVSVVPSGFRTTSTGPYQPLASDGVVDTGNESQDVLATAPEPRSRSLPVGASAVTAATLATVAAAANPNPNGLLLFVQFLLPAGMRVEGYQPSLHAPQAVMEPNPTKADTSDKSGASQSTELPLQVLVCHRGSYCVSRIINFWTGPNLIATSPPNTGNVKAGETSSEATRTPTTPTGTSSLIKAWALVEVLPPDPATSLPDPTAREQSLPEPLIVGIPALEQVAKQQQAPFGSALSGSTSGLKNNRAATDVPGNSTSVDTPPLEDGVSDHGARQGSVVSRDYGSSAGGSEVPQPWLPRMLLLEIWRGSKLLNSHTCVMHGALVEQPVPRFLPSAYKIPSSTPERTAQATEELQGSSTRKPSQTIKAGPSTVKDATENVGVSLQADGPTSLKLRAHSENIEVMNPLLPTIGHPGLFDPPPPAQLDVRQSAHGSDVSLSLFSTAELEPDPIFLRDLGLFVALMERDPSMQQATNPTAVQTVRQLANLGPSLLLHALECELYSTVEVLMQHLQRLDWRMMAGVPPSDPPLTELEQDRLRSALEGVTAHSNGPPHQCLLHLNDWLFDMNMQHG